MATSTLKNVRFAGMATCVPKRVISNLTDCKPQLRAERERLVRNIGIETRRMAQEWQCFSDLAFDAAERLLTRGVDLARELGLRFYLGWLQTSFGELRRRQGRFDEAEGIYQRGIALAHELSARRLEATLWLGRARLSSAREEGADEQGAATSLARALELAQALGDQRLLEQVLAEQDGSAQPPG